MAPSVCLLARADCPALRKLFAAKNSAPLPPGLAVEAKLNPNSSNCVRSITKC